MNGLIGTIILFLQNETFTIVGTNTKFHMKTHLKRYFTSKLSFREQCY